MAKQNKNEKKKVWDKRGKERKKKGRTEVGIGKKGSS